MTPNEAGLLIEDQTEQVQQKDKPRNKLTPEQHEMLERKRAKDRAKGINVL